MARILVCLTGASGAVYGKRLVEVLAASGTELHVLASTWGERVFREETGRAFRDWLAGIAPAPLLHEVDDLAAAPASGSFRLDATFIAPCSMATAAAIATGAARNLIHRAGAVALKEGRPLVLLPRESPLSLVDLRNLVTLAEAGAAILPAAPAFYHHPTTIEELVDQVVGKALDRIGLPHGLFPAWKGSPHD